MLSAFFNDKPSDATSVLSSKAVHDTLTSSLADMEAFSAHTAQLTEELKKVSQQQHADRVTASQEKQALESKWLLRLQCSRLESALAAGIASRDLRAAGQMLKTWAEVVGHTRREAMQQRREREQRLQLKLRDSGRAELLQEQRGLQEQATRSAMAAQHLRASLSVRSQELERTVRRDTMAFELWAADAARVSQVLLETKRKHAASEDAARAELETLRAQATAEQEASLVHLQHAQGTVASVLSSELAAVEFSMRVKGASQAVVVRLAVQQSVLHRYWKTWAVVASLLLREAGGALLQLELTKQQQRGVHTRLQAELASEVAQARVENLEARALLAKAEIIDQLRPTHELVTDKELLHEQRRALQAAHQSAASAHLTAAAHRVGEEVLTYELRDAEERLLSVPAASPGSTGRRARARQEYEYEKTSIEVRAAPTPSRLSSTCCQPTASLLPASSQPPLTLLSPFARGTICSRRRAAAHMPRPAPAVPHGRERARKGPPPPRCV